jgi:hypothetical protein
MSTTKKLALYGHDSCGTAFIAEPRENTTMKYTGKCPNPQCNRHVILSPAEIFTSIDKARREYIRKAKRKGVPVFWQPDHLPA